MSPHPRKGNSVNLFNEIFLLPKSRHQAHALQETHIDPADWCGTLIVVNLADGNAFFARKVLVF